MPMLVSDVALSNLVIWTPSGDVAAWTAAPAHQCYLTGASVSPSVT